MLTRLQHAACNIQQQPTCIETTKQQYRYFQTLPQNVTSCKYCACTFIGWTLGAFLPIRII